MYRLPSSFLENIAHRKGKEFAIELEKCILETESPISIRFKRDIDRNILANNFEIDGKVLWDENAFYLKSRPSFSQDPLWHAGVYYVQEASSMILGYLLKKVLIKFDHLKVLDLCAAPGGKSTQILSVIDNSSFLIANEILPKRAQILKENIIKSGYSNVAITNNDSKDFLCMQEIFDVVLIDAPCSGEGLFRKDKDAIDEWSIENIQKCDIRQKEILYNAIHLVKENGFLIYSTCTYNYTENIDQIKFLLSTGLFECINISLPDSFGFEKIEIYEAIGYQAFPSKVKGEGFFISVLKKVRHSNISFHIRENKYADLFKKIEIKNHSILSDYIKIDENDIFQKENNLYAWEKKNSLFIRSFLNKLKVVYISTSIGELKKDIYIPSQELALNNKLLNIEYQYFIYIDINNSIKYLKKENVDNEIIPIENKSKWYLIKYLNNILGWIKILPNKKQNNYYPLDWRLRK